MPFADHKIHIFSRFYLHLFVYRKRKYQYFEQINIPTETILLYKMVEYTAGKNKQNKQNHDEEQNDDRAKLLSVM